MENTGTNSSRGRARGVRSGTRGGGSRGRSRGEGSHGRGSRGRGSCGLDFAPLHDAAGPSGRGGRGRGSRGRGSSARRLDFAPLLDTEAGPFRQEEPAKPVNTTLHKELKIVRQKRLMDKKNVSHLTKEQKNRLLSLREKKEVSRFLMPDAPERKQNRKPSPVRVLCPLTVGTLTSPPPRVEPSWARREPIPGSSWMEAPVLRTSSPSPPRDIYEAPIPGPSWMQIPVVSSKRKADVEEESPKKIMNIFTTPSTSIHQLQEVPADCQLFEVDVELVGFTPTSSVAGTILGSPASPVSPSILDNNHLELWERAIGENGSDVDVDDVDNDDPDVVLRKRNAAEFSAIAQDLLSEDVVGTLQTLDAQDSAALRQHVNSEMLHFEWRSEGQTFVGTREHFTGVAGPTFDSTDLSPIELFEKIFDADIMSLIVRETNRYAAQLIEVSHARYGRLRRWQNVNESDIFMFFAILMLQSLLPHAVEKQYWYPTLPYLKIGNFQDLMSFHKFTLIKKCLQFVDNNASATGGNQKLVKIQPIIDHLNSKFGCLYQPEQCIAIDESILLWKGRLSFAQLILTKAARVGLKSYELCESRTGYLWRMIIYTGKGHSEVQEGQDDEPEGATSQIVLSLVRPLLYKGHTLVMDNFYNSPLLSRLLKTRKTDTMGTLRLNREFVPNSLRRKTKNNMRTGEVAFSQTHDLSVVVWKDNNLVSLLSTYHPVEVGGKEKYGYYKFKPQVVLDYNQSMGDVDKKDQLLQAFPLERGGNLVWYKKLFRRLLNVSVLNSAIIFNHNRHSQMPQRQFREILADQLIKKYGSEQNLPPVLVNKRREHYPAKLQGKARCKWCSMNKKVSRTVFKCRTCDVPLCIIDCFEQYHTQ